MPEYHVPGVYIDERRLGRGPIAPAGTSTTAFVGPTRKGPLNSPTAVASFAEYQAIFGAALGESLLSIAVLQYFSNGGREAVVVGTGHAGKGATARVAGAELVGRRDDETGIYALANARGSRPPANILVMPDASALAPREHVSALKAALDFCEQNRIFFIIDPPVPRSTRRALDAVLDWAKRGGALRHPNAAVYFPRVECTDPSNRSATLLVPASGAIAGVYARTDQRDGVWKAPAGTEARLLGVRDVEMVLTDAQGAKLQGAAINAIRPFPHRGVLAWGARSFVAGTENELWKYLSVRRLMLFVEESLYRGLQWTVFESNDESSWAEVRLSVSSFMNHLWRSGALRGQSSREAYFVKCNRETMTEADIQGGRAVALVGFAPVKSAEFIVLRIELPTADAC